MGWHPRFQLLEKELPLCLWHHWVWQAEPNLLIQELFSWSKHWAGVEKLWELFTATSGALEQWLVHRNPWGKCTVQNKHLLPGNTLCTMRLFLESQNARVTRSFRGHQIQPPHFTGKEIELPMKQATCWGSYSKSVVELRVEPRSPGFQSNALPTTQCFFLTIYFLILEKEREHRPAVPQLTVLWSETELAALACQEGDLHNWATCQGPHYSVFKMPIIFYISFLGKLLSDDSFANTAGFKLLQRKEGTEGR